jgi:hypothetical protein
MLRLKQLDDENGKLKKLVADLPLDKKMPQDVMRGRGRRHVRRCQAANCELAKRDQGSIRPVLPPFGCGSPMGDRSGSRIRASSIFTGSQGKETLSRQPAGRDRSAHTSRHYQGSMDLRTGASAVEELGLDWATRVQSFGTAKM